MNLIANTGIQLHTIQLEIDLNNNFKMFFHEWLDIEDQQKKMEIAHFFPEEEIWIKKYILYGSNLGYATLNDDYKVTDSWETISTDDEFDKSCISKSTTMAYNKDAAEEATKLISEFFNSTLKQ